MTKQKTPLDVVERLRKALGSKRAPPRKLLRDALAAIELLEDYALEEYKYPPSMGAARIAEFEKQEAENSAANLRSIEEAGEAYRRREAEREAEREKNLPKIMGIAFDE